MKSFLLGCGVVILILIVLGIGGFFFLRSTFTNMTTEINTAQRDLDATNRDFPFTAPADGKLAEDRLLVWIKVRQKMQSLDTTRTEQMQRGGFKAMKTAMNMVPSIMKEYGATLHEEKMSVAEYGWITSQVMGALKSRAAAKDPKMAELAALVEQPPPAMRGQGPQFNQNRRNDSAPLDSEDAQPVLELIRKHEAEFRKVARPTFSEELLPSMNQPSRPSPRREDTATTRSAAGVKNMSPSSSAPLVENKATTRSAPLAGNTATAH